MACVLFSKKELAVKLGISLPTLRKYLKITPGIDYLKIKYARLIPWHESNIIIKYYDMDLSLS